MRQSVIAHRVAARYLAKVDERALVQLIASRDLEAFEFPTLKSLRDYLTEHPKADKSKHTVGKPEAHKLHQKHENSGPEATNQAIQLDHAAKGVAGKITKGEATKADLATLKEHHTKLLGRAKDVEKDIAEFAKDEGSSALKGWGKDVGRALSSLESKFDSLGKAAERGFDRQDARTVKELGQAAQELAAHIGNAVKEMKRLSE